MNSTESSARQTPEAGIDTGAGAGAEWRRSWPIVVAGMAGMSISGMAPYSLGFFMDPMTAAFGWSRELVSAGTTVIAIFGVVLTPLAGALNDRFGPRVVALPGIALTSLAFAALGLTDASAVTWLSVWSIYAAVFVAIKPLVWSAAISRAFHRSRGLALAVALSGVAISQTLTPIATEWLIRTRGWRQAFAWLGIGWGGIVLLIVLIFFTGREVAAPAFAARAAAARRVRQERPGSSLYALFDANLTKITCSSFLLAVIGAGVVVHKVPILGEFGVDRGAAARLAATAGASGIVGKLATGWLTDRFRANLVGAFGTAVTGHGLAQLLPAGHQYWMIVASMLVLGFGAGAALQITVYLVSRFAPPGGFGRVFGSISALMALGAGLGPWLFGAGYSAFRSYEPMLLACVPLSLLSGWLIASLDMTTDRRREHESVEHD